MDSDVAQLGPQGPTSYRPDSDDDRRHRLAAEIVELGQALFDAVVEAATAPQAGDSSMSEHEPFPTDDARAAADQFFTALQILLEIRQTKDS